MPVIAELAVGDEPDAWRDLGFAVDDATCWVSGVAHRLSPETGKGVRAWALHGASVTDGVVDGIPTPGSIGVSNAATAATGHPNGVVSLDHVVLATPNLPRTIESLEATGLELRRIREAGPGMRQAFFRMGEVILEVAGPVAVDPTFADRGSRFFGLAYTVRDLDETAAFLGDRLRSIKDAVQPGRRIATLDKAAGSTTAIAFMSAGPLEYE